MISIHYDFLRIDKTNLFPDFWKGLDLEIAGEAEVDRERSKPPEELYGRGLNWLTGRLSTLGRT